MTSSRYLYGLGRLDASHPDGIVEDLDLVEAVRAEPGINLGVEEFPLVAGRIPVEGIEPPPAPVRMPRDGTTDLEHLAEQRSAIERTRRNRQRGKRQHDAARQARGHPANRFREPRDPVAVVEVDGQAPAFLHRGRDAPEVRRLIGRM